MELKAAGLYNSSGTQLVNTSGKALTAGHADTASNISGSSASSMTTFAPDSNTGGVRIAGNNSITFDFHDGVNGSTTETFSNRFPGANVTSFTGGSVLFYSHG